MRILQYTRVGRIVPQHLPHLIFYHWYLTPLIMWNNIFISTNNKPNSNTVVIVKTFYVSFIFTPQYNSVSNMQLYRNIGVEQLFRFLCLSWLCWASANMILKLVQIKISPARKPGKSSHTAPSNIISVLVKMLVNHHLLLSSLGDNKYERIKYLTLLKLLTFTVTAEILFYPYMLRVV